MNMNKFLILSSVLLAGVVACGDDSETGTGGGGGDGPTTTTTTGTTNPTTTSSTGGDGGNGQGGGGTGGEGGQGGEGGGGLPAAPELGAQLERMGRPGINTATVDTFIYLTGDDSLVAPSTTEIRQQSEDDYNAAANGSDEALAFIPTQAAQLTVLDSLDGECGNQPLWGVGAEEGQCDDSVTGEPIVCYGTLATVLNNDQLWVDTSYDSCAVYLGLEAAVAGLVPADTNDCGGRRPVDDVIETTYSVVSGALGADGELFNFDDLIVPPADLHPDTFPYLADPSE